MEDADGTASDAGSKASSATAIASIAGGSAETACASSGPGSVIGSAIVSTGSKDNVVARAGNVDKKGPLGLLTCWFERGTHQQQAKLQNIGTAKCPKMVCPACNSARRAMERQGRDNDEAKKALKDMKDLRQGEWKEMVRNSRLVEVNSDNVMCARKQRGELLKKALVQSTGTAETIREDIDTDEALWPDRNDFIGYHQTYKGMTREQAAEKWDTDCSDPAIERRGSGPGLRIKVMGIPTSSSKTSNRVKRGIAATDAVLSAQDLESAIKRMRYSSLNHDYDRVFGSGTAAASRASASSSASLASARCIREDNPDNLAIDIQYLKAASGDISVAEANAQAASAGQGNADLDDNEGAEVASRTVISKCCKGVPG